MWLQTFFFDLPIWLLVVLAWLPATLTAFTARLYALPDADSQHQAILSVATRASIGAYTFVTSFAINTLWNQNLDIYKSWEQVVFRGRYLESLVAEDAPAASQEVSALLNNSYEYLKSPEVLTNPLNAVGFFTTPGATALEEVKEAALPESAERLTAAFDGLVEAGQNYLIVLNAPGISDINTLAIVLLGMILAATAALNPPQTPTRFSSTMLAVVVAIVGLLQTILWVLNSSYFEARLLARLDLSNTQTVSTTGQTLVVSLTALALIMAVVVLTWRTRAARSRQ